MNIKKKGINSDNLEFKQDIYDLLVYKPEFENGVVEIREGRDLCVYNWNRVQDILYLLLMHYT